MIKISFILPCYNVERYIADCLNSIYSQDLPEGEFEVICVNDCSTDGTRSVILRFIDKYKNLILIDHEKNLTAGGARNSGIAIAKGDYIWFVDPDDEIKENCAHLLYSLVKDRDVDILMFNFETHSDNYSSHLIDKTFIDSDIFSGQEYALKFFPGEFRAFCIVWRCLFRSSFIKRHSLIYPEIRKSQDVVFLWKAMIHAERVCSVSTVCYIYKTNPFSVANKMRIANVAFSNAVLWPYQVYMILKEYDSSIHPSIVKDMEREVESVNSSFDLVSKLEPYEIPKYYDEIQKHKKEVDVVIKYMNKRNRVLYDTSLGKLYWRIKLRVLTLMIRTHTIVFSKR